MVVLTVVGVKFESRKVNIATLLSPRASLTYSRLFIGGPIGLSNAIS